MVIIMNPGGYIFLMFIIVEIIVFSIFVMLGYSNFFMFLFSFLISHILTTCYIYVRQKIGCWRYNKKMKRWCSE